MKPTDSGRRLRLQETIYPFGVGGIADVLGESFIGMDPSTWEIATCLPLRCPSLEAELRVATLREPPRAREYNNDSRWSLPYSRFPRWRSCQLCGALSDKIGHGRGGSLNECLRCKGFMVPMRFVATCETNGHLEDVPWRRWTHYRADTAEQRECKSSAHLRLATSEEGGLGLSAAEIRCDACGARRDLGSLGSERSLHNEGYRCRGRQPWEPIDRAEECPAELRVVQRGSTTVYIPQTLSALDIPQSTSVAVDKDQKVRAHPLYTYLRGQTEGTPSYPMLLETVAEETGTTSAHVRALIQQDEGGANAHAADNLLAGEWSAFEKCLIASSTGITSPDFDIIPSDYPSRASSRDHVATTIEAVGLVRRVREVIALTGFTRYKQIKPTRVDLGTGPLSWYPAIEKFGEGVFIKFDEDTLASWEKDPRVLQRVARLQTRVDTSTNPALQSADASPRFVLLHTFAHVLMRQLEFQSGYSASSLAERVYADAEGSSPQAGVLIYTASGDALGTLGGLVRLGEADLLGKILLATVDTADKCSNDPVCVESDGQGLESLNLAACHACTLASETSCSTRNVLLDRALLVGNESVLGFFQEALQAARTRLLQS